jgi:hypothetical protein
VWGRPVIDGKVPLAVQPAICRRPQDLSRVSDGDERRELALDRSENGGPLSLKETVLGGPMRMFKNGHMRLEIDNRDAL